MKKYLKSILLCIPIGLILCCGSVKAESVCTIHEVTKNRAWDKDDMRLNIEDIGLGNTHYNAFSIEGYDAFCMNPGLPIGQNYKISKKGLLVPLGNNKLYYRIYDYYNSVSDARTSQKKAARFFSQIAFWLTSKGVTSAEAAERYFMMAYIIYYDIENSGIYLDENGEELSGYAFAMQYFYDYNNSLAKLYLDNAIAGIYKSNKNSFNFKLYWWTSVIPGEYQDFITVYYDETVCTCPDGTKKEEMTNCVNGGSSENKCINQYCDVNKNYSCPDGTKIDEVTNCVNGGSSENECINKYCDVGKIYSCPDGSKTLEMTNCVNGGSSESECENKYCNVSKTYSCPDGSKTVEMTNCVNGGSSEGECINKYCTKCVIDTDTKELIDSCSNYADFGSAYEFVSGTCEKKYTGNKNNYYGRPTTKIGKYCYSYCLKSVSEQYPGNITKAVNVGRYIVWPNNNANSNSYKINAKLTTYPLRLTLTQTCHTMVSDEFAQDYMVASKAEEDWNEVDSGGNSIKQVFANYNHTCNYYTDIENQAEARLNKEVEVYNNCCYNGVADHGTCTNGGKTVDYNLSNQEFCEANGGTWTSNIVEVKMCDSCSMYLVNYYTEIYNQAKENSSKCNSYSKIYSDANTILQNFDTCISYNYSNNLDFDADYSVYFENEGSYSGDYQLYESSSKMNCTNCEGFSKVVVTPDNFRFSLRQTQDTLYNIITALQDRSVTIEITKTYDLKENPGTGDYYYYVRKDTGESTNLSGRGNDYSTIGFSNMPVSYSSKVKNYNITLNLNNITSNSMNDEFKTALLSQQYVCSYGITKTTTSECICPDGTKHAGENLDCLIASENETRTEPYTCSDAQIIYCDANTNISDYSCPEPGRLTCPNDPSMDLTACTNSGYKYQYCVDTFCYNDDDNPKHYVCPTGGTNAGMNLDACVIPMILKGYSEQDAYEYCKDVSCPYGSVKIIYRTISLQNPFPSYNADTTVDQNGLLVGMFNDTVRGRYPGKNWNSVQIVKSKILNNRKVDGDQVYNKEPLYTFTLTSDTIKQIRKYNKNTKDKYSNFDLNCLKNNSAACISENFVHNKTYGLTGGLCDKKLTASNFETCGS